MYDVFAKSFMTATRTGGVSADHTRQPQRSRKPVPRDPLIRRWPFSDWGRRG